MAPQFRWQSPKGHQTVSTVVKKRIPQWSNGLYPAQTQLIVRILDGEDIVCCMATGGGKSTLFAVPIIVLLELAQNPDLYPDLPSRALPIGIVITPTKGLAANIVLELKNLNVSALSYSHETVTEARKTGRNLAREIGDCGTWNVICVDPEHLRDKAWRDITANNIFRANIVYGCTDEAHLIRDWGAEFRPQFRHIGSFFRGRLPSCVSIMALSATILPGAPLKSICSSLGMFGDDYHLLRLSNERLNTQLILELENGVGGKIFPQLLAILNSGRKAIIHCRTIDDVLRVFLYLWKCLPPGPHRLRRLKMYHSLRSIEDNADILRLLAEDPVCQVAIATVALANRLNVKPVLDSISIGCPETLEQLLQEKGRAGRVGMASGAGVLLTFTLYCCDSSCFSPTGFGLIFGENYRQDREDSLAQRHLVSNLSYELKLRLGLFSTTPLTATSRCPEIIAKLATVSFKFFAFKTIVKWSNIGAKFLFNSYSSPDSTRLKILDLKSVLINSFCLLGGFAGWSGEFGLVPQLQVDLNRDRESQRV
ncbi:P-loop containing nucleoside triphosphate hydrolase protein [Mycena metata]|uniref:DNA 3'-5' helicase n=1 Tax=Mycena metata TaxID=1033252 RepID=A0AAD7HPQ0_9AGAR|nr:P-loop containing nucleoside triphosphate hydrolase protein [Mycena metata]